MKRFLLHSLLFSLPLLCVFVPSAVVLWYSGELDSLSTIEALQMRTDSTTAYTAAYSNFVYKLKQELTVRKHPSVLALGSSHVGQFRSLFFKDPSSFYNASNATAAMSDFSYFIDSLGDAQPQVLIMSTDISAFDPSTSRDHLVRPNRFGDSISPTDVVTESLITNQAWWKVYADYAAGKFSLSDVFALHTSPTTIGLYARANDSGYLNDGSTYDGKILTSTREQQKELQAIHTLAASISTTTGYEYGSSISPETLRSLADFLTLCKTKHIYVIGFIPPIPHEVYQKMSTFPTATYRTPLETLAPTLKALYTSYGFDFFDFSDIAAYGSSDQEMVDPYHGSEKTYLRLFIQMAKQDTVLAPLVDVQDLQQRLDQSTSPYVVFGVTAK